MADSVTGDRLAAMKNPRIDASDSDIIAFAQHLIDAGEVEFGGAGKVMVALISPHPPAMDGNAPVMSDEEMAPYFRAYFAEVARDESGNAAVLVRRDEWPTA